MARTYLQLTQRLKSECAIPGSRPTTLQGLTPEIEAQRLADWIADAWIQILQLHPDWRFRRRSCSFTTTNTQHTYTPVQCGLTAGTLGRWIFPSFRAYLTASSGSEWFLTEMSYDLWRDTYLIGANRTVYGQPHRITEDPSSSGLILGPIPTGGYTIVGDYYLAPNRMSADADTCGLPAQYDDLGIVWKAMLEYGGYEADSAAWQRANRNYAQWINHLEREQLPRPSISLGRWI